MEKRVNLYRVAAVAAVHKNVIRFNPVSIFKKVARELCDSTPVGKIMKTAVVAFVLGCSAHKFNGFIAGSAAVLGVSALLYVIGDFITACSILLDKGKRGEPLTLSADELTFFKEARKKEGGGLINEIIAARVQDRNGAIIRSYFPYRKHY